MSSMEINRRHFSACLLASFLLPRSAIAFQGKKAIYLSAFTGMDQKDGFAFLDQNGEILAEFPFEQRGHGAAHSRISDHAVIFARRPGTLAAVVDLAHFSVVKVISSREDRHFYGHGAFSHDGRFLFASENDFDNEQGVIGIYDTTLGYARIGEVSSHGIGPHELAFMPNQNAIIVANGGILTHPSAPRMKLNIADMQPSLVRINPVTGELLARAVLPDELHQLSIRHLSINPEGLIAVAMQWEGNETSKPQLIALWDGQGDIRLCNAPEQVLLRMKNYCGSVSFNASGKDFIVSSPRGGIATVWNKSGYYRHFIKLKDTCGVSKSTEEDDFILTNGFGFFGKIQKDFEIQNLKIYNNRNWDNHILFI